MTRTSRRWIRQALAGFVGVVGFSGAAQADGWLHRPKTPPPIVPGVPAVPCDPAPSVTPQPTPQVVVPKTPEPKAVEPKAVEPKVDVPMPLPEPSTAPPIEPFVSAALGSSAVGVSFQPAMFGDLIGRGSVPIIVALPPNQTPPTTTPTGRPVVPQPNVPNTGGAGRQPQPVVVLQFPQLSYGSFKVAENDSPRPTDRVFATYTYYDNLPTSAFTPGFDVHRQTVGFEKTFLDQSASIGVRVPFIQLSGADQVFNAFGVQDGQFGDISVIAKYAFYDDRSTGNLLSGGLMVTAPTGEPNYIVNGQRLHSTLLQPWGGMIWNLSDSVFVHGFSSIVFPTDPDDVTAWYNDFGVGFWLRKGQTERFFHGIVPTAEVHVGTPLNNRGNGFNQVHISDYVSLVGGVNFVFWRNSTIGFAAGSPVTGPRPWDFEANASINFRF